MDTSAVLVPFSAVIVTTGRCVPNPGHGEWEVAIVTVVSVKVVEFLGEARV
jgi:hypothetical protein